MTVRVAAVKFNVQSAEAAATATRVLYYPVLFYLLFHRHPHLILLFLLLLIFLLFCLQIGAFSSEIYLELSAQLSDTLDQSLCPYAEAERVHLALQLLYLCREVRPRVVHWMMQITTAAAAAATAAASGAVQ